MLRKKNVKNVALNVENVKILKTNVYHVQIQVDNLILVVVVARVIMMSLLLGNVKNVYTNVIV